MSMHFRHKTITHLRLLAGVFLLSLSMQQAHAQYNVDDNATEDWQLYDEDEAKDSVQKPRHKEWKNMVYVQYSPTQYTFPGCSPHLHFQEASIGWARSMQIADSISLFVEAGANIKYSRSTGDAAHANAKYNLFTLRIPINLAYKFYLSNKRSIALVPYAGAHFRVICTGKEKYEGKKHDLFKDDDNHTGTEWDRCQLGWQVGLRLQLERFFIGADYSRDFPDKSKKPHIHESGITAGICF